jgi:hypothetical protein
MWQMLPLSTWKRWALQMADSSTLLASVHKTAPVDVKMVIRMLILDNIQLLQSLPAIRHMGLKYKPQFILNSFSSSQKPFK